MPLPSLRPLALLLLLLAASGCTTLVAEDSRACPCADGWTCCEGQCVPGGPGACIVPDRSAPEAPRLEAADPASPTARREVTLSGHAEPHARVRLYTQPDCAGDAVAEAAADGAGVLRASVTLAPNALSVYWARATDAAGNGSQCSAPGLAVRHDDVPPGPPQLSGVSNGAAAAASSVQLLAEGRAEALAQVQLFSDEACLTPLGFEGASDAAGAFRVWMDVPAHVASTVYARAVDAAGNVSACSAGLRFGQDDLPPAAPALSAFVPSSPSRERNARWEGSAEPGAHLRVYGAEGCAGAPLVEQDVGEDGRWSLQVLAEDNATTRRWATVTDAAGNGSPCTLLGAYVHDTVPPRFELVRVSPSVPTSSPDAALYGTTEPGATVYVSASDYCEPGTALASHPSRTDTGSFYFQVRLERSLNLYAHAVDGAGNSSGCYVAGHFEYDITPPATPQLQLLSEPSPGDATDAPVELSLVGATEESGTIAVYTDAACSVPVGFGQAEYGFHVGPLELIPAVDVDLYARAWDPAGNASGCTPEPLRRTYATQGLRWRPAEPGVAGAPWTLSQLRLDGHGGLWAVRTTGTQYARALEIVRRDVAGGAWSTPRVLEPQLHDGEVSLAINARGDLLVAWVGLDPNDSRYLAVRAARYEAGTQTWGETVRYDVELNWNYNGQGETMSVALGDDGQAFLCWREWLHQADTSLSQRHCARAPAGGAWESASVMAPSRTDGRVLLLAGSDGRARALWRNAYPGNLGNVYERTFTPGTGWSEPALLATSVLELDAALGPSGTAWATWTVQPAGSDALAVWARRAPDVTADWEPPVQLSTGDSRVNFPRVTGEGLVSWIYTDNYRTADRAWFSLHTESGWAAPTELQMPGYAGEFLPPVQGAPGETWFTWVRTVYAERSIRSLVARRLTASAGLESAQAVMCDPVLNSVFAASVTADREGRLAAAWHQFDSDAIERTMQPRLRLLR